MEKGDSSNRVSILFERDNCLHGRSTWATCSLCVDSCPGRAIRSGEGGVPSIDHARCLHCGQCLAACPLEAFRSDRFTERQLVARIPEEGAVRLRCFLPYGQLESLDATCSSYQLGTCLAALSPGVLFELAFARPVLLDVGRCSSCSLFHRAGQTLQCNVQAARDLLACWDRRANLRQAGEPMFACPMPPDAAEPACCAAADRMRASVRSLFHGREKNADARRIALALRERPKHVPSWRQRVRQLWSSRKPAGSGLSETPWPSLVVDARRCRACGICRQLCPTGSIFHEFDGERFAYCFVPGTCVDCGLCIASCQRAALSRDYRACDAPFSMEELFEGTAEPCSRCGMPVLEGRGANDAERGTLCTICAARSGRGCAADRIETQMRSFFQKKRG